MLKLARSLKGDTKRRFDGRVASVITEVAARLDAMESVCGRFWEALADDEVIRNLAQDGSYESLKAVMFCVGEYS